MSLDDFANKWGHHYLGVDGNENKNNEYDYSLQDEKLASIVQEHTQGKFTCERVCENGTKANCDSICLATKAQSDRVLYASGCYISGDEGLLIERSVVEYSNHIYKTLKRQEDSPVSEDHFDTIALPYYLDQNIDNTELVEYENKCLMDLEIRIHLSEIMPKRRSYKALFMELMLAQNGAGLSNRAIEGIARICKKNNITIIVDEIMTGGRVSSDNILLVMTAPESFLDAVEYVTLGKWMGRGSGQKGMGMVLIKTEAFKEKERRIGQSRDSLGGVRVDDIIPQWIWLAKNIQRIPMLRARVLGHFGLESDVNVWGQGLMIFSSLVDIKSTAGVKNRLLIKLHGEEIDHKKFDSVWDMSNVLLRPSPLLGQSKTELCKQLQECIESWTGIDEDRVETMCRYVLSLRWKNGWDEEPSREQIIEEMIGLPVKQGFPVSEDPNEAKSEARSIAVQAITYLRRAGYLTMKQRRENNHKRRYVLNDEVDY